MARKLAVSTQLKAASAKIEELEKNLKQQKDYAAMYQKKAGEAEAEVEQIHQVLDAVPGSIARKAEDQPSYGPARSAVTRMAAWLAGLNVAHR